MPRPISDEVFWVCPSLDDTGNGTGTLTEFISGNDGAITGATWVADTTSGGVRCLYFNGAGHVVNFGDLSFLDLVSTDVLACHFWIKFDAAPSAFSWIFGRENSATGRGWSVRDAGPGNRQKMRVLYRDTSNANADSTIDVYTNTWTPIGFNNTGAADMEGCDLYVSGSTVAKVDTGNTSNTAGTIDTTLGQRSGGSGPIVARIDDLRIWTTSQDSSIFAALATQRGYQPPSLASVLHHHFEAGYQ